MGGLGRADHAALNSPVKLNAVEREAMNKQEMLAVIEETGIIPAIRASSPADAV